MTLSFDQSVKTLPNGIRVYDETGALVSGAARGVPGNPLAVEVTLRRLPKGAYTVRWSAISNDSHVGHGVFTFGVRVQAPALSEAFGASGPTTTEHVVRWLYFICLALLTGGLGFRLFVLRGDVTPEAERRFYRLTGAGVVGALEVGIVAFLLRAQDALQLPFTSFLYGDLSPFAHDTRFGEAFVVMELGFSFVAALLFLAWLTERRWLLWPAFLLSLGLGSGLSLASHQADDRGWLPSFADWVHLSAATLWIGGLLSLGLVVWRDRDLRRTAFWRFSEIAGPLVAHRRRRRRLHDVRALPGATRPLDGRLRTSADRQARARLARPRLGRVPSLRGPPAARPAGRRRARVALPGRRGHGGDLDPPAGRDPGRLEAAGEARAGAQRRRRRRQVTRCYKPGTRRSSTASRASNTVLQGFGHGPYG